jgi:hypothetical protein
MRLWGIRLYDRGFPFFGQGDDLISPIAVGVCCCHRRAPQEPPPFSFNATTTMRFAGRPSILRPPRIDRQLTGIPSKLACSLEAGSSAPTCDPCKRPLIEIDHGGRGLSLSYSFEGKAAARTYAPLNSGLDRMRSMHIGARGVDADANSVLEPRG